MGRLSRTQEKLREAPLLSWKLLLKRLCARSVGSVVRFAAREPNLIAFQVVDSQASDSARGDYVGPMTGVVRPLLLWMTEMEQA